MGLGTGSSESPTHIEVVVVGAGFAGLYMLYRLRGMGIEALGFEAAADVGGTWYYNRYPGCRCDVESLQYSYSFSNELLRDWQWTERYATQPEILKYIRHVADRFDLRRDIRFNTRVSSAVYDEKDNRWRVTTDRGDVVSARFCVMASGCLSIPRKPAIPGVESFAGEWYHTGQWPANGVDFTAKRVGVIGTGSTGLQLIPQVAKQAAQLYVFQRTAAYSLPAKNRPITGEAAEFHRSEQSLRDKMRLSLTGTLHHMTNQSTLSLPPDERETVFERLWEEGGAALMYYFNDVIVSAEANEVIADFVRRKIAGIVKDPATAKALTPHHYPIGTKRICIDIDYFETYNRDNVTLVPLADSPIEEILPRGLRTAGATYDLDCLVFATGYDALTGALLQVDIRGVAGQSLREKWHAGPRTYLGLASAGFPNLFMITGPGSPSVLSNMMISIEQHVDWIAQCLEFLGGKHLNRIEPRQEFEDAWVAHVGELAGQTLFVRAASWYMGANIPGKPQVFMPYIGGVGAYRQKCAEIASEGYTGFELSSVH
jgi:cyclohexanone monooxygenase